MKIILQHRILLWASSTIDKGNNNNTLELVIVNDSYKYFQQMNVLQHYCDNLEDKSIINIIKSLKYNNHRQIIKQTDNKIMYSMDINTLSELKKCILKTNCNIIEITDCDTRYDKSSKYGYFVELCESLDKFKTLIYVM